MVTNTLITGIPRSGTTLLTSLLAQHGDGVVFSEPEWLKDLRQQAPEPKGFVKALKTQLEKLRTDIQQSQPILLKQSKITQGLPSNYYLRDAQGNITSDKQEVSVVLPAALAAAPFIIKANAQFTACLETLCQNTDWHIIAVVRNPVAAILSWRSLDIPVSHGRMKIADQYADDFTAFTQHDDLLVRQVLITEWFFKQYQRFQDQVTLIRYEDLIERPAQVLQTAYPAGDYTEVQPLQSHNRNRHYPLDQQQAIEQCLMNHGHHFRHCYPDLLPST